MTISTDIVRQRRRSINPDLNGNAAAAIEHSPGSVNEIGTCRQDDLSEVRAGIDQLVSAASVGKRKGLVDNRLDLAALDVRPDLPFQFIDDGRL